MLVQPDNVGMSNGSIGYPGALPKGPLLPNALLSGRYPAAVHGMVYGYAHSETGVVTYVDPLGGGAAAWRFRVTDLLPGLPLGAACTGSTPWAGAQLAGLRVRRDCSRSPS